MEANRERRSAEGSSCCAAAAANASEDSDMESSFLLRNTSGNRRRRGNGEPLLNAQFRRSSLRQEMGHAAAETYLITRLTIILLQYLGYVVVPDYRILERLRLFVSCLNLFVSGGSSFFIQFPAFLF